MGLHKLYTRGLASWSLWAKSKKTISVIYKHGTQPRLLIYIPSVVAFARQQQNDHGFRPYDPQGLQNLY